MQSEHAVKQDNKVAERRRAEKEKKIILQPFSSGETFLLLLKIEKKSLNALEIIQKS